MRIISSLNKLSRPSLAVVGVVQVIVCRCMLMVVYSDMSVVVVVVDVVNVTLLLGLLVGMHVIYTCFPFT